MRKVIAFPARPSTRAVCPTVGALALAPQEIEDAPEEFPSEQRPRQVEVISFPGAWDREERPNEKAEHLPDVTFIEPTGEHEGVKTRIGGSDKNSEIFSRAYVDPFFPLAADVYRLASRSPPKFASAASYSYNNPLRYWDPSGYSAQAANQAGGVSSDGSFNNSGMPYDPRISDLEAKIKTGNYSEADMTALSKAYYQQEVDQGKVYQPAYTTANATIEGWSSFTNPDGFFPHAGITIDVYNDAGVKTGSRYFELEPYASDAWIPIFMSGTAKVYSAEQAPEGSYKTTIQTTKEQDIQMLKAAEELEKRTDLRYNPFVPIDACNAYSCYSFVGNVLQTGGVTLKDYLKSKP